MNFGRRDAITAHNFRYCFVLLPLNLFLLFLHGFVIRSFFRYLSLFLLNYTQSIKILNERLEFSVDRSTDVDFELYLSDRENSDLFHLWLVEREICSFTVTFLLYINFFRFTSKKLKQRNEIT